MIHAIRMHFGRRKFGVYRVVFFLMFVIYVTFVLYIVSSMQTENDEVTKQRQRQARQDEIDNLVYRLQTNRKFRQFLRDDSLPLENRQSEIKEEINDLKLNIDELYQLLNDKQNFISNTIRRLYQNEARLKRFADSISLNRSATESLEESFILNKHMVNVHNRVYNKFTEADIKEYYNRERRSYETYGRKVLDINKDRLKLMALFPSPDEQRDRVTDQLYTKLNVHEYKLIHVNKFAGDLQSKFQSESCNVKQCRFTRNRSKIREADVLFSSFISEHKDRTNTKQVHMTYMLEPAAIYDLTTGANLNWTATYRRDSVINTPYERFTSYKNITSLPNKTTRNYATGKTKMVAWIVSNCRPKGRMAYAKKLQKYVNLDIYGYCGKLKCPRKYNKRCLEYLKKDYKFYLAFENTNCKDYITEKFFRNGLQNDVIPIVMGAKPEDYKAVAPPNSYIHVDDFDSPKELAEYLHFLDQNDEYFNQYFLWKDTGRFINTKFLCRVCLMAHLAPFFPMWYSNTTKWWFNRETCSWPTEQNRVKYSTWQKERVPIQYRDYVEYPDYVKYGYDRLTY